MQAMQFAAISRCRHDATDDTAVLSPVQIDQCYIISNQNDKVVACKIPQG